MFHLKIALSVAVAWAGLPCWGDSTRYICDYQLMAEPGGMREVQDFSLEFTFDTLTGDAFLRGNNGVSEVFATQGSEGITFLEPLVSGAVQVTVVTPDGSSAHSRHTIIAGDLVPSQYYGDCEIS
ncbi:MAG: hypothetical protein LJE68_11610 [Rhodobacter sp.]|nr:hypothetical protein [Rhodobacter sp.]